MKPIISFSLLKEDPFLSALSGPSWSIWVEQTHGKPVNNGFHAFLL
jgi:hypothetical protein